MKPYKYNKHAIIAAWTEWKGLPKPASRCIYEKSKLRENSWQISTNLREVFVGICKPRLNKQGRERSEAEVLIRAKVPPEGTACAPRACDRSWSWRSARTTRTRPPTTWTRGTASPLTPDTSEQRLRSAIWHRLITSLEVNCEECALRHQCKTQELHLHTAGSSQASPE